MLNVVKKYGDHTNHVYSYHTSQPIHCAFSISCEDLQYFWEPLRNSSAQHILRMRSPTPICYHDTTTQAPMQIIDFVRAKVAAGSEGSLQGATENRSSSWKVDGIVLRIVGPISILRLFP